MTHPLGKEIYLERPHLGPFFLTANNKMNFDDLIIQEFEALDSSKFLVSYLPPIIFLCGGEVNVKTIPAPSVRQRLIEHFNLKDKVFAESFIQAEIFKDYLKEEAYSDLLEFESDIANIATLIIICLESPGSLVELGLFCVEAGLTNRLLIIAPSEEVENADSFIYLGPLENLKRKDPNSVIVYPWAKKTENKYDHLELMANDVIKKFKKIDKTVNFKPHNNAHIAFLIYDIVLLSNPIMLFEIELALHALKLDVDHRTVSRTLYLLEKIGLISRTAYSSTTYFYEASNGVRRIKFGTDIHGKIKDTSSLKMAFRQSYVTSIDEKSKKRTNALKQIAKLKEGNK